MSFETTPLWNPTSTAPPWDWNPVATGLSAYYTVQKNRRDQEEFELAREMEQYLMPIKQQAAKLELEKVVLDMEKTKAEIDRQRAYTREATENIRGGWAEDTGKEAAPSGFRLYQGADAGSATPKDATSFPQEDKRSLVAEAAGESDFSFNLKDSPFQSAEDQNPLYALATDDLGERLINDPATMGAGPTGTAAGVQDSAPVKMNLTDPRTSMMGGESDIEKDVDKFNGYNLAQLPEATTAQGSKSAEPQGSGDGFYDWATTTLREDATNWKNRKNALADMHAQGKIKTGQFLTRNKQLDAEVSEVLATSLTKLDKDQQETYKSLVGSKVEPLDALLQVATARPRNRGGAEPKDRGLVLYEIEKIDEAIERTAEGSPEFESLLGERRRLVSNLSAVSTPASYVDDLNRIDRENLRVARMLEVNPDIDGDAGLTDMFTQAPIRSRDEAEAYQKKLQKRRLSRLVDLENTPEAWQALPRPEKFSSAQDFFNFEKSAPDGTPYINERGAFTIKGTLKKATRSATAAISDSNPFKEKAEVESKGAERLNNEVAIRQLTRQLQSFKEQRDGLESSPAPFGSDKWRASQWEKLSEKIGQIESRLKELQSSQ